MAYERTASFSNFSSAVAVPTYFDSVVCFSRPWVLTKPKFRLAFVQPSALQGNGNRFSRRNAPKQPTRNTVGKKRVRQEDMDFDYLSANLLPRPDFFNDLNCRVPARWGSSDGYEVSLLPPGHDAWVVGDEPVVVIHISGMANYAKPA
jgi:hypothetical protein